MSLADALFVVCAAVALASALIVITRRNAVYAVLFMLPLFLAMALLFFMLAAPFMAAMQILVYGGVIIVVFLFVIMLLNLGPEDLVPEGSALRWVPAVTGGTVLLLLLGYAIVEAFTWKREPFAVGEAFTGQLPPAAAAFGTAKGMGLAMFESYVVPFELASVLIVVAILGAILLSKERL